MHKFFLVTVIFSKKEIVVGVKKKNVNNKLNVNKAICNWATRFSRALSKRTYSSTTQASAVPLKR